MVNLSRIYTKNGDGGKTRLGDHSEVPKTDVRVEAFGTVDELNAIIGLALASGLEGESRAVLQLVQNDLFDLGGDLCCPQREDETNALRIQPEQIARLEQAIDVINKELEPLRSFVLPGGTAAAAWFHLARTVCRRAERCGWRLAECESINEQLLIYLNRLSDLFFVLARQENKQSSGDVLWEPGKTQEIGRR